ncbi:4-oxalocrotonate decarboxylase [Geomicrobium sp. JCM 19039]|nr:4-oxalocrotonate decarboxylase [Geomicrobium sp. JCM 19039]
MTTTLQKDLASHLLACEENVQDTVKVTKEMAPDLTIEEAYLVQEQLVQMKLDKGLTIVGPKMGLTSKAKLTQMNVDEPIYGYVFSNMVHDNKSEVSMKELIHPKVEAEIAFELGEDIEGPGVPAADVMRATAAFIPAVEIIDSRYKNFEFTLPDVIADNASSSKVVFGERVPNQQDLELDLLGATITINDEVKAGGAGAAVLGHPANAIAMLVNMLAKKGEKLKKGQIILSGQLLKPS